MQNDTTPANDDPESEKKAHDFYSIVRWRCPNCGQLYFCAHDETPPDICQYCRDMTTWQRLSEEP